MFHPVLAHVPTVSLEQRRDPAVAKAPMLAGKLNDGTGHCIFVMTLCRLVALRTPRLFRQPARIPLTGPMLLLHIGHRTPPPLWP